MTRPTRLEVNCETGEQTIIELTDAEIEALEQDRLNAEAEAKTRAEQELALAEIKASAIAKLAALGLSEDEAKAIAGA